MDHKLPSFTVKLKSNGTGIDLDLNKPTTAFLLVIILCAVVFPIAVALFSLLRPKVLRIYAPRPLLIKDKLSPLGKLPSSFFAWVSPAYMLSDDVLFEHLGMDALIFMRFLRLCFKLALFAMPFGLILLLPLNLHGANKLADPLDRMSVSNIKDSSPKMWAHWVCVWLYSAAAMYFLYEEWKVYILYRQAYMSKGKGKQFVTLLYDLDKKKMTEDSLRTFANTLFPGKISGTYLIQDLVNWDKLVKEHDNLVEKLEIAKAKSDQVATESRNLVDSSAERILKYEKKLQILQVRLEEEQFSEKKPIPAAIIVFTSLSTQMVSVKMPWDITPFYNLAQPGPDPKEIIWTNLSLTPFKRRIRYLLGEGLVVGCLIIWSPAVALISSLKNLKALAKQLTFLKDFVNAMPSVVIAVLQGIAPSLLLFCLYIIVAKLFAAISRFQGLFSRSQIEKQVFRNLALFNVFNTFFVFVVSSSIFGVLYNVLSIIESPSDIPLLLASSLPSQANFYINYIALLTFCLHSVELTRILPLILYSIKNKWCAKTPKSKFDAWNPGRPRYAELLTSGLLVFMVGIAYSVLSPIIVPFLVLYFGFGYVVWAYQLVYVYVPDFDLGGELWPMIFGRLISGLLVFQLLMVGILFLRKLYFAGGLLVILVAITCAFWHWVKKYFSHLSTVLARTTTVTEHSPEIDFLKGVRRSYIKNSDLPSIFSPSSSVTKPAFEYENYTPMSTESEQELEGYITK